VVRQSDDPAAAILQQVWTWPADLIVMATHGRRGLRRVVRGSVVATLLSESPVPLLVTRPGGHQVTRFATLLVPVDGSPAGAVALTVVNPLARMTRSRVVLLQVVGNVFQYAGAVAAGRAPVALGPEWQDLALMTARSYVEGHAEQLRRAGIQAEGRVVQGRVGATIVRIADEVGADLIVMSTRASRGPARAVLGSAADEVLRTARRPVLLVRHND
jgi:nucleotide-binding universal stress UspA family protein